MVLKIRYVDNLNQIKIEHGLNICYCALAISLYL